MVCLGEKRRERCHVNHVSPLQSSTYFESSAKNVHREAVKLVRLQEAWRIVAVELFTKLGERFK